MEGDIVEAAKLIGAGLAAIGENAVVTSAITLNPDEQKQIENDNSVI